MREKIVCILLLCLFFSSSIEAQKKSKQSSDTTTHLSLPDVNVFIENSASMDGYVSGGTQFKDNIYSLLTDLKSRAIIEDLNLHYINDTICVYRRNAGSAHLTEFIKNLNPTTFKTNGCKRTTSDLPRIIKNVIADTSGSVSILVSDCIISTGNGDLNENLVALRNGVELIVADQLRRKDFSTVVVKMKSKFTGRYFVEAVPRTSYYLDNVSRPYYILMFGPKEALAPLLSGIHFKEYDGFEAISYFFSPSIENTRAKILMSDKIGEFNIVKPTSKLTIDNLQLQGNTLQLSVAVAAGNLGIEESYLLDPKNYDITSSYSLVSVRPTSPEKPAHKGYSHIYVLRSDSAKTSQLIELKLRQPQMPRWVIESSTKNDIDPHSADQQNRSFGLEYLFGGFAEGYHDRYDTLHHFALNIKIDPDDPDKRSGGVSWGFIVMLIAVASVLLWIKIKR